MRRSIFFKNLVPALILSFFTLSGFEALCATSVDPSLEKRVRELERALEESQGNFAPDRPVQSYLSTNVHLGGFTETGMTGIFERDHGAQAAVSSSALGINLGAEFSESLRLSSQFLTAISIPLANPHDDPRASTYGISSRREFGAYSLGTLVTQAYLEWEGSDAFRVSGGIGYAPYAISFQQLELVLFVRRGGPQLLRSGSELVHLLWQGVHVRGSFNPSSFRWGYNVYTFSPASHTQMLGVGTRLWASSLKNAVTIGFSTQTAARGAATYTTAGPDLRLRWGPLTVTSELAKSYGPGAQPWSFHFEPDVDVYRQAVLLYVFGDYFESVFNRTGGLPGTTTGAADPFKKWEYGAGANWLPTSFTRLRLGGTYNQYVGSYAANPDGRNYWQLDASVGVAF